MHTSALSCFRDRRFPLHVVVHVISVFYSAEIRQEAVLKALELYKQLQNQIPLPIRRPSQRCVSNGDSGLNLNVHSSVEASVNTEVKPDAIAEEQESCTPTSPDRQRRSFADLACNSNSNNLNANLDLDAPAKATQPAAMLNLASPCVISRGNGMLHNQLF